MNVTGTNVQPAASFAGSESGTTVTLNAGSYGVTENNVSGYTMSSAVNCSGTIANGETKTCTITNDDLAPTLIIKKICAPTTDTGSTFTGVSVTGLTGAVSVTCNVPAGTTINSLSAGDHTVGETLPLGWASGTLPNGWTGPGQFSGDCDSTGKVTLVNGQSKTCYILNVSNVCTPAFSYPATPLNGSATIQSVVNSQSVAPQVGLVPGTVRTVPNPTRPALPRNSTGSPARRGQRN